MKVVFSPNKDNKTANLFVDESLINEDIPYIPRLSVDHRGATLYYYARENGVSWAEFNLDEATTDPQEVKRGFLYLFSPKHVLEDIRVRSKPKNHDKHYKDKP